MKTIVHLSDLHFGKSDKGVIADLKVRMREVAPDIIVVSGDLTQRARVREFIQARRFLDSLSAPKIIVPGNHDIPLYDLFRRFFRPLTRYQRIISKDLEPFYADSEIAVAGINTARSLTLKNGRINKRQLGETANRFAALAPEITRVVVVHHPFGHLGMKDERDVVGRANLAFDAFSKSRIDLILAGHLHSANVSSSSDRYKIYGYSALLIQAGTATSSRRRGEANSFNVIKVARPLVTVDCKRWNESEGFVTASHDSYSLGPSGWARNNS